MSLHNYFRGLSDLTRLRIINLLLHEELCGCDIQRLLGITQPLASRHLVYLKRSGLVADHRDGFRVFYRLAEGSTLRDLFACLQRAFREQEPFGADLARLRVLREQGHLGRDRKQQPAFSGAEASAARISQRKHGREPRRRHHYGEMK
jgi:ArsR family transcriptional regulator, arsenate/arsenite/antimonite-responsive transcriptional repressor